MGDLISICSFCLHHIQDWTCVAFPEGIPRKIKLYGDTHFQKHDQQEGHWVFTPKTDYHKKMVDEIWGNTWKQYWD